MLTSKQGANEVLYATVVSRIEAALKERKSPDEVTYVSVSGLPMTEISRIQAAYQELNWTVTYEYCPGEYEDLWFS